MYNAFFARQNEGALILRIEDTDTKRTGIPFVSVPGCACDRDSVWTLVPGAYESMMKLFTMFGFEFDEGPHVQGQFGPYKQSERLAIYATYAQELVMQDKAYLCFCTPERLERLRAIQSKQGYLSCPGTLRAC